jgi:hypothetical protein
VKYNCAACKEKKRFKRRKASSSRGGCTVD